MQVTVTIPLAIANPVSVVTAQLPQGYVGQSYSCQLQVAGGFGPYSWSATGLPTGLTCSTGGLISGTPAATFSGNVTLTVVDANG